jgi:D-alanyl-D-alanine carboxypeptidase/D-alanyl-D-alanine-endopeptidase (penicillin-binding protein 4)
MKSLRNVLPTLTVTFAFAAFFLGGGPADAARAPASPTPTPNQRARTAPTASPTPSASPTPQASASPTPSKRVQTLEELQSKIRMRLADASVRRGRVGVKIVSLASGKVIFENDAEKYFMPASNMKNFTVAAGFERLGPDFRFVTSVYAAQPPDSNGVVRGDVRIYGRGDVSISTAFNNGDYFKGLDNLVDRIAAAGVKKIEGALIADESYFKGFYIPGGWEWDDLQSYYGAEVSPLPINDNAVDVTVTPGPAGSPCVVTVAPFTSLYQITNLCTTTATGIKRSLSVIKKIDRNVLEVTGTMPTDDSGYRGSVSITRPAELFVGLLKQRLELRGITVGAPSRLMPAGVKADSSQVEIAKLESLPYSRIAANTMKPSQNMFTETVLWTLGEQTGRAGSATADSSDLGIAAVKAFLKQIGIADDGIIQYDGSGLSRHNLVTPEAVVKLYTYMAKQSPNAQAWRDSLTIAGVDGTLANRLKGTAAEANFRGKTGTIDQVSALSGYMKTAAGEELVVSIIVNGVAVTRNRTSLADDIVVALANFNGKVDSHLSCCAVSSVAGREKCQDCLGSIDVQEASQKRLPSLRRRGGSRLG